MYEQESKLTTYYCGGVFEEGTSTNSSSGYVEELSELKRITSQSISQPAAAGTAQSAAPN